MSFINILTQTINRVGIIRMNKPKTLNALDSALYGELIAALQEFDNSPNIGAIILTGTDKVFVAGADIKYIEPMTFSDALTQNILANCEKFDRVRTPIIGVVNGYALGGGFELALACDILYAGESALFGLPEVTIGTIPGGGGTQRLTRLIGKTRAMEMILTGKKINAKEAENMGIVSGVYPDSEVFNVALETATKISNLSKPIILSATDAVNTAYNTTLDQGLNYERRVFESTFSTEDKHEGMKAFMEKRKPDWSHK